MQSLVPASTPLHSESAVQPAAKEDDLHMLSVLSSPPAVDVHLSAKYVSPEEQVVILEPVVWPSHNDSEHEQPVSVHSKTEVIS